MAQVRRDIILSIAALILIVVLCSYQTGLAMYAGNQVVFHKTRANRQKSQIGGFIVRFSGTVLGLSSAYMSTRHINEY